MPTRLQAILLVVAIVMISGTPLAPSWADAGPVTSAAGQWGTPVQISDASLEPPPGVLEDPLGDVYLVWTDDSVPPYTGQLAYRRRNATTGVWSATGIFSDSALSLPSELAAGISGTVHLVWTSGSLYSTDYTPGLGWSVPISLPNSGGAEATPELKAGSDGWVQAAWRGQGGQQAMYAERNPAGTWLTATQVFTSLAASGQPRFAINISGTVYAVAPGGINQNDTPDVWLAMHMLGGGWSAPFNLSNNATQSGDADIGADANDNIYVVWSDQGGPSITDILYRARINGTWGAVTDLSNNTAGGLSTNVRLLTSPDGTLNSQWLTYGSNNGCYVDRKPAGADWEAPVDIGQYGQCAIQLATTGDLYAGAPANGSGLALRERPAGGAWGAPVVLGASEIDGVALAAGAGGRMHAVWSQGVFSGSYEVMLADHYALAITSTLPTVMTNTVDNALVIAGDGFLPTPAVYLGSTALSLVGISSTRMITAQVPSGFPAGTYGVTVTNPDGVSGLGPQLIQVRNPAPVVAGVTPTAPYALQPVAITITGQDFVAGATVLVGATSLADAGWVNGGTLTATVPAQFAPGKYAVSVRNAGPGAPIGTLAGALDILFPWLTHLPIVQRP